MLLLPGFVGLMLSIISFNYSFIHSFIHWAFIMLGIVFVKVNNAKMIKPWPLPTKICSLVASV